MKKKLLLLAFFLLPGVALAQVQAVNTSGLRGTIQGLTIVVNYAISFFLVIAIISFIIGVIKVILANGPEEKGKAREFLIWAIVGVTVILGIFGISRILLNIFGVSPNRVQNFEIPTVGTDPFNGSSGLPADDAGRIYDPENPDWN